MNEMTPAPPDATAAWEVYRTEADSPRRHDPYLLEPFPTALDDALDAVVSRFQAMSERERRSWKASLAMTQRDSQILLTYAARMATQALREASTDRIVRGLVAHLIEGERDDWRENVIVVTLLFDAGRKLQANPLDLFQAVASLEPGEPASDTLVGFRKRRPEVLTIESMGYRTAMTAQGVRYEPDPSVWKG
jgi:hypothetical protein